MNGSRSRRAIFSNKDAFFFFHFYLINLRCHGVGVYGNNQVKADVKKVDRANGVNRTDRINRADKADRANRSNRVDGADRADGSEGVDGAD